jgi:hypothetical protein
MTEKISAVLYSEKIVYIGASGPPSVRNIWIPSYNIIIDSSGQVYRGRNEIPYRCVQEQLDDIEQHGLGRYYIDNIVDPKPEDILLDRTIVEKALQILAKQNSQKELQEQLKNEQKEFITEIPFCL